MEFDGSVASAFAYIHGTGPRPTEEQLGGLRGSMQKTIARVDYLQAKIHELESQLAAARAENQRLSGIVSKGQKPANIEEIDITKEDILANATPCAQMMRFAHPSGHDVYIQCMTAGMPIYGGRCPFHAPKRASARPTASAGERPSFAAAVSASASSKK